MKLSIDTGSFSKCIPRNCTACFLRFFHACTFLTHFGSFTPLSADKTPLQAVKSPLYRAKTPLTLHYFLTPPPACEERAAREKACPEWGTPSAQAQRESSSPVRGARSATMCGGNAPLNGTPPILRRCHSGGYATHIRPQLRCAALRAGCGGRFVCGRETERGRALPRTSSRCALLVQGYDSLATLARLAYPIRGTPFPALRAPRTRLRLSRFAPSLGVPHSGHAFSRAARSSSARRRYEKLQKRTVSRHLCINSYLFRIFICTFFIFMYLCRTLYYKT